MKVECRRADSDGDRAGAAVNSVCREVTVSDRHHPVSEPRRRRRRFDEEEKRFCMCSFTMQLSSLLNSVSDVLCWVYICRNVSGYSRMFVIVVFTKLNDPLNYCTVEANVTG